MIKSYIQLSRAPTTVMLELEEVRRRVKVSRSMYVTRSSLFTELTTVKPVTNRTTVVTVVRMARKAASQLTSALNILYGNPNVFIKPHFLMRSRMLVKKPHNHANQSGSRFMHRTRS